MSKSGLFTAEMEALTTVLETLGSLDEEKQQFVLNTASHRLGIRPAGALGATPPGGAFTGIGGAVIPNPSSQMTSGQGTGGINGLNAKQFIQQKHPRTDVDRVACLAYYVTKAESNPHFTNKDITKANSDAAQPRLSNPAYTIRNATNQNHYLAPAGKGTKQITALGEEVVEAMPNWETVAAIIQNHKSGRRKIRKQKNTRTRAKN